MSGELKTTEQANNQWMSAHDTVAQVSFVQQIMRDVMRKDTHYGTVPGCGDKPALLKAGAEKLCFVFRLAAEFEVTKTDLHNCHREYYVKCTLIDQSGCVRGSGVGSCSTMESKYRWRSAERLCPSCGRPSIINGKAEYGGGYLCFQRKGGCGAKFELGDKSIESQIIGKIENQDIADQYNTALKMAKKRAHVDATITTTATSDIFAQDIDDLPQYENQANTTESERLSKIGKLINAAQAAGVSNETISILLNCEDWESASDEMLKNLGNHIRKINSEAK